MSEKFPKDWKIKPLGSFIKNIGDGGTPSTSDQSNFGGGIPWIVISDIQREIWKTKTTLSEKGLKKSSSKLWKPQTVILSTGATIGQVGIAKTKLATKQGITGIECDDNLLPEYLYYFLKNNKHLLLSLSQGSTIEEIRAPTLVKLNVSIPPLPEQKKIASILTSVDEVIEKTQSKINKLQDLKKTTMNELLTKGIGHTEFKDGPLGKIPKSWLVTKLKKVAKVNDGTHKTPKYITQGIPFLRVTDLKNKYPMKGNNKYISISEHQELIRRCKPEKGDILYSKNGTIGIPRIIDWEGDFSIFVSLALIKINRDSNILSEYLEIYLSCEIISQEIKNRAKQGAVTNLHLEEIREFLTIIPNIEEQKQIIKICRSLNQNIGLQKDKVLKLTQLKKSLMQDLLTGKVRVLVN